MTLQQSVQLPHDLPSNGVVGAGILSMTIAELLCQTKTQVEVVGKFDVAPNFYTVLIGVRRKRT
jgi:hypothetical protein